MQLDQAYNSILNLQKKLHSEHATSANFEEVFNQELKQQFNKDFLNQMISDKQYYSQIFLMKYFKNEPKLPFSNPNALFLNEIDQKEEIIPDIFKMEDKESELFSTLEQLLQAKAISSDLKSDSVPTSAKKLTDFITYSIIPSLFLMFTESNSFDSFCELINNFKESYEQKQISDPFHYTLSRSIFVSPMFLKFIKKTIYPCIKPIYEQHFPINLENYKATVQKKILQSFKKNICFIPSYILLFFEKMKDTKNFLVESLFNPMFENPEHFLIVDAPLTDFNDIIEEIKIILKSTFTSNLIEDIAKIIDSCKDSEKALFIPDKKNEQFYYKIINSMDIKAFSLIEEMLLNEEDNGSTQIDLFDSFKKGENGQFEYHIFKSQFDGEQDDIENKVYNATTISKNDCWMYFRKLLKDAPPLPNNYQIPNEPISKDNFIKMIKELLVDMDDPFASIRQAVTYNLFTKIYEKNKENVFTPDAFEAKMKSLVLSHQEQVIAMKMMSQFRSELDILQTKKSSSVKAIQEIYCTILTSSIPNPSNIPNAINISKLKSILSNPIQYKKDFKAYFTAQEPKSKALVGSSCCNIWFRRFYYPLNFANYCAYRTDLAKLDVVAQRAFSKYIDNLGEITAKSKQPRKSINKAIYHLDMLAEEFQLLYSAFESNDDPLTKIISIGEAFEQILTAFFVKFKGEGEDDFTPFRNIAISFINPPRFISNVVFMLEYFKCQDILNSKDTSENIFTRFFAAFLSIFEELGDKTFVNNSIYYHSRMNHRRMELFITGSNTVSIISLFNAFVSLSRNQPPVKAQLDEYHKLIESDPRKPIHYSLDIVNFTDNSRNSVLDGEYCVSTDIYFGKNIPYDSESNYKPDAKVALYAFQSDQTFANKFKGVFVNETKDFASSSSINNRLKFIVYDPDDDYSKIPKEKVNIIPFTELGIKIINILKFIGQTSE